MEKLEYYREVRNDVFQEMDLQKDKLILCFMEVQMYFQMKC